MGGFGGGMGGFGGGMGGFGGDMGGLGGLLRDPELLQAFQVCPFVCDSNRFACIELFVTMFVV